MVGPIWRQANGRYREHKTLPVVVDLTAGQAPSAEVIPHAFGGGKLVNAHRPFSWALCADAKSWLGHFLDNLFPYFHLSRMTGANGVPEYLRPISAEESQCWQRKRFTCWSPGGQIE